MGYPLAGQGIVITGGAGDLGAAMAAELLGSGARVTLIDSKDSATAGPWLEPLREHGAERLTYVQADVRDRPAVERALERVDPLEVVIGNAGIVEARAFLDITEDEWRRHLDINLTGCFHLGQVAARLMVARGHGGRIIFTGSWVQEVPWPEDCAYSVSKAGLRMLARSMARELAEHGILVNVVAPGIVDAGLARRQIETEPQFASRAATVIPLGKLQTPEQVAKATAFLCSQAADYMTGATLLVDGGCSLFKFD